MHTELDRELITRAVKDGIREYAASRRRNVDSFVAKHFSFRGAWRLNKLAFGRDMYRAPVNLIWSPVPFFARCSSKITARMGMESTTSRLKKLPTGMQTDVDCQVEWLLYSEFLELPYEKDGKASEANALLFHILAQGPILKRFEEEFSTAPGVHDDPNAKERIEQKLSAYLHNRKDVAELTTTIIALSACLAAHKGINMGAVGIGQTAAAALAHQVAVSNFFLGPTLGGAYYSLFPAAASMGMLMAATGGAAATLGVASAFAGVVADPIQKALGLHHKKLLCLVDNIERELLNEKGDANVFREGLITRIMDLLDAVSSLAPRPS